MELNWHLLLVCLSSIVLAVFYLFYWNRLLAGALGYALRLTLWWSGGEGRVWIEFESLQVSLLAGRVTLKDAKYHSSNQTIRVTNCTIVWRYWIRRAKLNDGQPTRDDQEQNSTNDLLPCRIHIHVRGFEWLLYNRTPAFDALYNTLAQQKESVPTLNESLAGSTGFVGTPSIIRIATTTPINVIKNTASWFSNLLPTFELRDVLPVSADISKFAVTCGNPSTPCLLIGHAKHAQVIYGLQKSRSPLDLYKHVIATKFSDAKVNLVANPDYDLHLKEKASGIAMHLENTQEGTLNFDSFNKAWIEKPYNKLPNFFGCSKKRKSKRDSNTMLPKHDPEYAMEECILETRMLEIRYLADEPGLVPEQNAVIVDTDSHLGNGDLGPDWVVEVFSSDAIVRYGPWADRQRVHLQRAFFPPVYRDMHETSRALPGSRRIFTSLRVYIEVRNNLGFHIPFREPSKNWMWDNVSKPSRPDQTRKGTSLQIKCASGFAARYVLPMVVSSAGYTATADITCDKLSVFSPANDILFLQAKTFKVSLCMGTPLAWRDVHRWSLDVTLVQPVVHMVRDHITLLTDLGKDWTSGPPPDFDLWFPTTYVVQIAFSDYELRTFVNDHNIIDYPQMMDENAILAFSGSIFRSDVHIFSDVFSPESSTVPFAIEAPNLSTSLFLPKWDTHSVYSCLRSTNVGHIKTFRMDGSFLYFHEVQDDYIDHLKLNMETGGLTLTAFGWAIRRFMIIRDNYFGSFTNFSTLGEYIRKRAKGQTGDDTILKYREGQANAFEVTLDATYKDNIVVVPAGLPGFEVHDPPVSKEHIESSDRSESLDLGLSLVIQLPEVQLQFRTHDSFMEMSVNAQCYKIGIAEKCIRDSIRSHGKGSVQNVLNIDGLDVVAHRLFGPKPLASTYLCIWEISIGEVRGKMSPTQLRQFYACIASFATNFEDLLNSPAAPFNLPSEPDVTFLAIHVDCVDLSVLSSLAAINLLLASGLSFNSSNPPSFSRKSTAGLKIPSGLLRLLLRSTTKPRAGWMEAGLVKFDLCLDKHNSPPDTREHAESQISFITQQDSLTHRADHVLSFLAGHYEPQGSDELKHFPISLSIPRRPETFQRNQDSLALPESQRSPSGHPGSDDDEDEPLSDFVRDARLANSRITSNPLHRHHNPYTDDSMSSGDEDGHSESDNSESTSDTDAEPQSPNREQHEFISGIRVYKPFLPHFRPELPGLSPWSSQGESVPSEGFQLCGDSPMVESDTLEKLNYSGYKEGDLSYEVNSPVTIDVWSLQDIDIRVTPLTARVLSELLNSYYSKEISLELRVDEMLTRHLASATSNATPNDIVVHLNLAGLRVTSLSTPIPIEPEAVVHPHVIEHFWAHTSLVVGTNPVTGVFFQLHAKSVHTALGSRQYHTDHKHKEVQKACEVHLLNVMVSFHQQACSTVLGSVESVWKPDAPRAISSVMRSWAHLVGNFSQNLRSYERKRYSYIRYVLWTVLDHSRDLSIMNPLSLAQPSYLVQPKTLRTGVSYSMLTYLRLCLANFDPLKRLQLRSIHVENIPHIALGQIESLVRRRWAEWIDDSEAAELVDMPLLRSMYGSPEESRSSIVGPDLWALGVEIHHFSAIESSNPRSISEISLNSFNLVVRLHKHGRSVADESNTAGTPTAMDSRSPTAFINASLVVGEFGIRVYPPFLKFVEEALKLRSKKSFSPPSGQDYRQGGASGSVPASPPHAVHLDVMLTVGSLRIRAFAEKLLLELSLVGIQNVSSALYSSDNSSVNVQLACQEISARARSIDRASRGGDSDVLLSTVFTSTKLSLVGQQAEDQPIIRLVCGASHLSTCVPRSATRTYRFIEDWKADYLPSFGNSFKGILQEFSGSSKDVTGAASKSSPSGIHLSKALFDIQVSCTQVQVTLQVMHGIWLSWDVFGPFAFLHNSVPRDGSFGSGLRTTSQVVTITSRGTSKSVAGAAHTRVKVELPALTVSGTYDDRAIHASVQLDYFKLLLKPKYFDDLLAVQQNFGTNYNELLSLIARSRQAPLPQQESIEDPTSSGVSRLQYKIAFYSKGFQIGIPGPSSTQFLDAAIVQGSVTNTSVRHWKFRLQNFALSLAPHSGDTRKSRLLNVKQRSAFVILDLDADGTEKTLSVRVTRFHAVMSTSSIGELGDLVDHVQAEMRMRTIQRAAEIEEMRLKGRTFMKTFDVDQFPVASSGHPSWLDDRIISLDIANFGVAFPLADVDQVLLSYGGATTSRNTSVPAFLFSVTRVSFRANRFESGNAKVEQLSFQFVPTFNQAQSGDFVGSRHRTRNRLVYPEMSATLKSSSNAATRNLEIDAAISGFILDIEATIVDYVYSLVAVYHQGKRRLDQLVIIDIADDDNFSSPRSALRAEYSSLPTSNVCMVLRFKSGKLRVHAGTQGPPYLTSHSASLPVGKRSILGRYEYASQDPEVFDLPTVSVWGEFHAVPAARKVSADDLEPSQLAFKTVIHPSNNTLRPNLLQFITQVTQAIDKGLERDPHASMPETHPGLPLESVSPLRNDASMPSAIGSMHFSFSLQIHQSRLELTCLPDVNVVADLEWDSGGFVVNILPGANFSLTGSIGRLTASLRHGYLREKCAEIDARNVSFLVSFARVETESETAPHLLSIIVDTELSAALRFSRLQDILCFRAVWLDRIPILEPGSNPSSSGLSPSQHEKQPASNRPFTTFVLVRARHADFNIDMGQPITSMIFSLQSLVARTSLSELQSEVEIGIAQVNLQLERSLSGSAATPDFLFHTVRQRNGRPIWKDGKAQTLEMNVTCGPLDVLLNADGRKILHYHAEPVKVSVYDDLAKVLSSSDISDRELELDFNVSGGKIIAMATVSAIPRLLTLTHKMRDLIAEQREGAAKESMAFRITQLPKPKNPLTAVASAMIKSARSRFSELDNIAGYTMFQRLRFDLAGLRLVIFNRSPSDHEAALFTGTDIHADLLHITSSDEKPSRNNLRLALSAMRITKAIHLNHSVAQAADSTAGKWLSAVLKGSTESIIFHLPSLEVNMASEELQAKDGEKPTLLYDFQSKFLRRSEAYIPGFQPGNDADISLDISLYLWLAEFRSRLAAEIAAARPPSFVSNVPRQKMSAEDDTQEKPSSGAAPMSNRTLTTGFMAGTSQASLQLPGLNLDKSERVSRFSSSNIMNYEARSRDIMRPTIQQLGEATPDILHPFFSKRAGFSIEAQLPVYIHEYATMPLQELVSGLLKVYSRQ
ncbi:hypothetical protein SISNIDRAFT_422603, partial [Sistotremastrum niveocremeum HHB9708]